MFMNPPYSAKLVASCMYKFLHEYRAGHIQSGIILTNNATETRWFQATLDICLGLCLTDHRIGFWNADGKGVSNNTRGQVFFYFGKGYRQFKSHFKAHGMHKDQINEPSQGRKRINRARFWKTLSAPHLRPEGLQKSLIGSGNACLKLCGIKNT